MKTKLYYAIDANGCRFVVKSVNKKTASEQSSTPISLLSVYPGEDQDFIEGMVYTESSAHKGDFTPAGRVHTVMGLTLSLREPLRIEAGHSNRGGGVNIYTRFCAFYDRGEVLCITWAHRGRIQCLETTRGGCMWHGSPKNHLSGFARAVLFNKGMALIESESIPPPEFVGALEMVPLFEATVHKYETKT